MNVLCSMKVLDELRDHIENKKTFLTERIKTDLLRRISFETGRFLEKTDSREAIKYYKDAEKKRRAWRVCFAYKARNQSF